MSVHHQNSPGSRYRRIRQAALSMLLLLLIEMALPLSALAYEGDHYVWTYYLALHVGFNRRQAYQIADAAYAIDWDKDTGPMEATVGDAFFGADHTGFVGTAHPQIARIWSRFHAFKVETGNFIGAGDQLNIRARNLNELWALALSEGNPGPYLHLLQDSYAHGDYDTVRGHAIAGHKPDFLIYDMEKAKTMTRETIRALSEFMTVKLGKTPNPPDMARIYEVLDLLFRANPIPNAPNIGVGFFEESCKKLQGLGIPCPVVDPNASSSVAPSLLRSLTVINRVVAEDEKYGRLPKWPNELGAAALLPPKWYQFDYDSQGKIADRSRYTVEKLVVEAGQETVKVEKIDERNVRITVRLPYKISGMLDLINGQGSPFLSPLPVIETHQLSDARLYPKTFNEERRNGEFSTEMTFDRPRTDLQDGKLSWECSVRVYGQEPITRQVPIPPLADTKAEQDCKAMLAQAQQLLKAGKSAEAARMMTEAQQKCGNLNQKLTEQLRDAQKQLEEEAQKLADDAQININKCEYEAALRQAEQLQQINPNDTWLINKLPELQPQAEAQHKAREFIRTGMEAMQRKDIGGAITSLRQARSIAGVPQCLLDQINKLLRELELRKQFMEQTERVQEATIKCDYKEAARLVGDITRITPREQYITDWLSKNVPILSQLQTRERNAIQLINQADSLATQAEAEAAKDPADMNRVATLGQQAMQLLQQADQEAPKCLAERKRMEQIRQRCAALANRRKPDIAASIALLIDTSGSMGDNNKINQAKDAARRAARQASKTTEIAILHFDGGCSAGAMRVAAGFTSDVNVLLAAIDKLQPGGGTPMYIATAAAVEYAQKQGRGKQRTVVLMSDGGDSCRDQQAQAAAAIRSSNIPVSTIGFDVGNNQQAQGDLGNLATMTGGRTFSASAADPREIIRAFNLAMLPSLLKDFDFGNAASNVANYFTQAKTMVQQQNVSGALMMLQQANQLAPNSPNLNFNLSLLYESEDQLIPAMKHANNYLQLAPTAIDRADVENRIAEMQKELQANPRVVMDSSGCRDVLSWAQTEQDAARRGRDVARRQAVLEILIAAQRGECDSARKLQTAYQQRGR